MTYNSDSSFLSLVAGLESAKEGNTISRLSLQLPVANKLGNEL